MLGNKTGYFPEKWTLDSKTGLSRLKKWTLRNRTGHS